MRRAILLAGLLAMTAFATGQATAPPFQSSAGKRAKAAYDQAVAKATAEYEAAVLKAAKARKAAVAEASRDYAVVLQHEIELATKAAKLDDALALRTHAENVARNLREEPAGPADGLWVVQIPGWTTERWFWIEGNSALYLDVQKVVTGGTVTQEGRVTVLKFPNGTGDRMVAKGRNLLVEHTGPTGEKAPAGRGKLVNSAGGR